MKTITLSKEEVDTLVTWLYESKSSIHESIETGAFETNQEREEAIDDVASIDSILKQL